MKSRIGFVSNSSSSSFIVARAQVGDENFAKIIKSVKDNDNIEIKEQNANYLFVDTSMEEVDIFEICTGLTSDDYITYYE